MTRNVENDALCIYYDGCDEPRNTCGYCDTHCLCGAPSRRVFPPGASDA